MTNKEMLEMVEEVKVQHPDKLRGLLNIVRTTMKALGGVPLSEEEQDALDKLSKIVQEKNGDQA